VLSRRAPRGLVALAVGAAVALASVARADDFPARPLERPYFTADVATLPAAAGSLDVEVSWEVPVRELTFRRDYGYYRARYDVSIVCTRDGRQIGGDVWERRVRLDTFDETRSTTRFARGHETFRLSGGDFEARVRIRDRGSGAESHVEGKVDAAELMIGLGDVRLVRYTGDGQQPNPRREVRWGEEGHRVVATLRPAREAEGRYPVAWRDDTPDGKVVSRDTTVVVTGGEDLAVEMPLPVEELIPGTHRLRVTLPGQPGAEREIELSVRATPAWFAANREETLEILEAVSPGDAKELEDIEGEVEWRQALGRLWKARDPDPETQTNEFVANLAERTALAATLFREPFRRPGWRTDRGKVLLQYGEPDRRSVRPPGEEAPASELWEYDSPSRRFLFVDFRDTGEYWLEER
jgi:GWxTD domain-containing protein